MFSSFQPLNLCDIEGVSGISVSKEDEVNRRVEIQIKDPAKEVYIITILLHHTCIPSFIPHTFSPQSLVLVLEERDAEELVLVLAGYFTLATESDLSVTHVKSTSDEQCEYLSFIGYHSLDLQRRM